MNILRRSLRFGFLIGCLLVVSTLEVAAQTPFVFIALVEDMTGTAYLTTVDEGTFSTLIEVEPRGIALFSSPDHSRVAFINDDQNIVIVSSRPQALDIVVVDTHDTNGAGAESVWSVTGWLSDNDVLVARTSDTTGQRDYYALRLGQSVPALERYSNLNPVFLEIISGFDDGNRDIGPAWVIRFSPRFDYAVSPIQTNESNSEFSYSNAFIYKVDTASLVGRVPLEMMPWYTTLWPLSLDWASQGDRFVFAAFPPHATTLCSPWIYLFTVPSTLETLVEQSCLIRDQELIPMYARWSPNDETIAYWTNLHSEGYFYLNLLNLSTRSTRVAYEGTQGPTYPGIQWSPDGHYIAFTTRDASEETTMHIIASNEEERSTVWSLDSRYKVLWFDWTVTHGLP